MEINRTQPFIATINGVKFTNEMRFNLVEYLTDLIEEVLDAEPNAQFVEDLDELIHDLLLASELTYSDIERILRDCIFDAGSFDTLRFKIDYLEDCTEYINEQLAQNTYRKA